MKCSEGGHDTACRGSIAQCCRYQLQRASGVESCTKLAHYSRPRDELEELEIAVRCAHILLRL